MNRATGPGNGSMFHYIVKIEPKADHKLWIEYEDGESGMVDFYHVIERGGVFATLGQPGVFDQVRIGEHGRYVEWPGNVDFCADALREQLARTVSPADH